ncbi:hypothetical protein DEU56DRAFT_916734 [Suillus clintonianus]|uniref:uncharacterized protein n=1 Tax=Suillus clintonianus TaxID=1904413 RepID=UPI001B86634B|nr:uncharacterized protein DEU56DRAFT_916734 [Suillus clintonianus]KAG2125129.1 hypothetical protein DEU56DRAFT_916734 [Suillus clintonianus]
MSSSADEKGSGSNNTSAVSSEGVKHPRAQEADKGKHDDLHYGVVVDTTQALWSFVNGDRIIIMGQVNPTTSANSTCVMYATYAFFVFLSVHWFPDEHIHTPMIIRWLSDCAKNWIGAKRTLLFETLCYALYVGSYLQAFFFFCLISILMVNPVQQISTLVLAGLPLPQVPFSALLGIFISIFWAIFNLGAAVGTTVSFGQNIHSVVCTSCLYLNPTFQPNPSRPSFGISAYSSIVPDGPQPHAKIHTQPSFKPSISSLPLRRTPHKVPISLSSSSPTIPPITQLILNPHHSASLYHHAQ